MTTTSNVGTLPVKLFFKRISADAKLPAKQHSNDAGYDVTSTEAVTLFPGIPTLVPLGIAIATSEIKQHFFIKIESRSGLAVKGVSAIGGVVDSGYRGEIKAILINHSNQVVNLEKGARVAQLVVYPIINVVAAEVFESQPSEETTRGAGGFGSTGL